MPGADSDITATLADLEHKLLELESELASAAHPPAPAPPEPEPAAPAPEPPPPAAPPAALAGLYDQMHELERFRETLEQSARALVDEYTRILEHLKTGAPAPPAPAPPAPAPEPTADLDSGLLAIDAGPFGDIATLGRFEQALGRLPGVQDVYVKGFEGHRALIEVELGTPIDVAAELGDASPLRCVVRRTGPAAFAVDLEGAAGG